MQQNTFASLHCRISLSRNASFLASELEVEDTTSNSSSVVALQAIAISDHSNSGYFSCGACAGQHVPPHRSDGCSYFLHVHRHLHLLIRRRYHRPLVPNLSKHFFSFVPNQFIHSSESTAEQLIE